MIPISSSRLIVYSTASHPLFLILISLVFSSSNESFGSFLGGGLAALQREISIPNASSSTLETQSTNFEIGWCLSVGFEIRSLRNLAVQLELFHAQVMNNTDEWKGTLRNPDGVDGAWDEAFREFDRQTSVRFSVGYRL